MATFNFYNHTANLFMSGGITSGDTFTVMLLNSSAVFTASHTALDSVSNSGAYEVSGNGWTTGGEVIANVTIDTDDTDSAMLDGDNISVTITGGALGPFTAYVIYATTLAGDLPLGYISLDTPMTVSENNAAVIDWSASGIIRINAPA